MDESFITKMQNDNLSANTISSYTIAIKHYFSIFNEISKSNLLAYKGFLIENYQPKTVNLKIQAINKYIDFINKSDLKSAIDENNQEFKDFKGKIVKISALNNTGIEEIYDEITRLFDLSEINLDNEVVITNVRQKNLISKAIESVDKTKKTIFEKMPLDIVAIYIKEILEDLGNITGEFVTEDIINEIFAKFCLGK